jgi:hypothetical protein
MSPLKKVMQFYERGTWKACADFFLLWLLPVGTLFAIVDQLLHLQVVRPLLIVLVTSILIFVLGMVIYRWGLWIERRENSRQNFDLPEEVRRNIRRGHLRESFTVLRATEIEIQKAASLARITYPLEHDRIPEAVMFAWYQKNPEGFYIMRNRLGEFLGNLDLLALKPDTYQRFVEGDLLEREIRARELYSPAEKAQIRYIHVESLVVCMPSGLPRTEKSLNTLYSRSVGALASKIPDCIREMCSEEVIKNNQLNICAISANPAISDRLQEIGAEIIGQKENRRDKHDLYLIDFEKFERGIRRLTYGLEGDPNFQEGL